MRLEELKQKISDDYQYSFDADGVMVFSTIRDALGDDPYLANMLIGVTSAQIDALLRGKVLLSNVQEYTFIIIMIDETS